MKPLITKEFKAIFNEMLVEIKAKQDGSGRFTLNREFDNTLYSIMEKAIALCEQYGEDQAKEVKRKTPYMSADFMHICDVEY